VSESFEGSTTMAKKKAIKKTKKGAKKAKKEPIEK
jgi:hypothetical protein